MRALAFGLVFSWVKLLKFFRAFEAFGPFVVMLGNMLGDTVRSHCFGGGGVPSGAPLTISPVYLLVYR